MAPPPRRNSVSTNGGNGDGGSRSIEATIRRIEEAGSGPTIQLADVLDSLGSRSFAPLLLVPALVAVSPLSGIVGVSAFCGIWIALIAVQLLFGRDHVWMPAWMQRRTMPRTKVAAAVSKLRGPAHWLDRHTRERLTILLSFPFRHITSALMVCLGLAMPFLELVPFSGSLAGATVTLLALGILFRDGLFIIAGLVAASGVVGLLTFIAGTAAQIVS